MSRYEIPVFRSERDDGVAEAVRANASVAYLVRVEPVGAEEGGQGVARAIAADLGRAFADRNPDGEFDLYRMKDVLVTAGVINKNRDAFDRLEVWGARHTPEDKPFNLEHEPLAIIGHITASRAVDTGMNEIADDTPAEDLPAKYHLVNGSVLYMSVEGRQDLMERTVAEIERGEWFVSMECFFRGFDYGVTGPDGTQRVVSRGADTAWLTKHLVQYGGTGKYVDESTGEEYHLSRVLRNITFSGKGLVRKPANEESVILNAVASFDPVAADSGYLTPGHHASSSETEEPTPMAESNAVEQSLRDDNARLIQQVAELRSEVAGLKSKDTEAALAGLRTQVEDLRKQVADRDVTIAGLNTQVAAITEASRTLEQRAVDAEASLVAAREELGAVRASEVSRARVAKMRDKGAESAVAEALADTWSHLTDEQFAATLDRVAASWRKPEATPARAKVDPVMQAISGARAEPEPSLATASEDAAEERQQSFAKITGFMGESMRSARSGRPSIRNHSSTTDAE